MKPAYQVIRDERRRAFLEKFLREMVIPDDFTSSDAEAMLMGCDDASEALCEHFGLGDGFVALIENIDFDMYDFLTVLVSDLREEEREAAEDYYERRRGYRKMQGGLC